MNNNPIKETKKTHLDNWFTKNSKIIYQISYFIVMLIILILAITDQVYGFVSFKAGEASVFFIIDLLLFGFYISYQVWISIKKMKENKKDKNE